MDVLVNKIPCCLCGTMILPNAANQCTACLAQNFDLKQMIQGKDGEPLTVHQCRQCRRYARTETHYEDCEPESPQLLSICLKHIPVLVKRGHSSNRLKVVDASWIWTEPNSMRLKVRVTVRTDMESVTIQQRVPVEYIVRWKMCTNCNREYTNRTWHALVQLRQKREAGAPRKGLAALEMALSRNRDIRKNVIKIDASRHGLDFYFLGLPQAQQFTNFLSRLAPMRTKTSSKMVSADAMNNTANMKHTLTCDMVPLCRDDLILVHKHSRSSLGGRIGLVTKVSSVIHVIDASPKRNHPVDAMELSADGYYKGGADKGFTVLQTSERMIRFVVLDVEPCDPHSSSSSSSHAADHDDNGSYKGPSSGVDKKYALADVQVARESDLGSNDEVLSCVTHLGHLIQPGDVVLGYDLVSTAANLNATIQNASSSSSNLMGAGGVVDLEEVLHSNVVLQDAILVKKVSAKEQREAAEADGETSSGEHGIGGDGTNSKKKRGATKKKLRRQQKQDKKVRELEESAARMGFLDDLDEARAGFAHQLSEDPEFAEELDAVERELAASYPEGGPIDEESKEDDDVVEDSDGMPAPPVD